MMDQRTKTLRNDYKRFGTMCRGFHANPDGRSKIGLYGDIYVGDWVYGYYYRRNQKEYILGGYSYEDAFEHSNAFEIVPQSCCRCTGLLVGNVPLFEYDVIDLLAGPKSIEHMIVYWNADYMQWGVLPDENGKSYMLTSRYKYKIMGSIFDR